MLNRIRQNRQGESRSRKEKQQKPNDLADYLRFLHGVGHTGDHQTERGKGDRAYGNQDKERPDVAKVLYVEQQTCQSQLNRNSRQGQNVVGDEAGRQHVGWAYGGDSKPAKNPLLTKHDQRSAQSPKTSHDSKRQNRTEEISHRVRVAFSEDA